MWIKGSALLAATVDGRWTPGIGDPTPMGWFTVVAYVGTAVICWRAARLGALRMDASLSRHHVAFWTILSIVLALLAVNKQLDLQTLITDVGRTLARQQGWYDQRSVVQMAFIGIVATVCLVSLVAFVWCMRDIARRHVLAIVGLTFLLGFILIRASSFHHMDRLIGATFVGLRMNWIFELGGIGLVCVSAIRAWRKNQVQPLT